MLHSSTRLQNPSLANMTHILLVHVLPAVISSTRCCCTFCLLSNHSIHLLHMFLGVIPSILPLRILSLSYLLHMLPTFIPSTRLSCTGITKARPSCIFIGLEYNFFFIDRQIYICVRTLIKNIQNRYSGQCHTFCTPPLCILSLSYPLQASPAHIAQCHTLQNPLLNILHKIIPFLLPRTPLPCIQGCIYRKARCLPCAAFSGGWRWGVWVGLHTGNTCQTRGGGGLTMVTRGAKQIAAVAAASDPASSSLC